MARVRDAAGSARATLAPATSVLRLGRLPRHTKESLIIEYEEDGTGSTHIPPQAPLVAEGQADEPSDCVVVEDDVSFEDFESEDVPRLPHPASRPGMPAGLFVPGSAAPRRLMQARAQQCVVCMEEREHTFVPPHREDCAGHDLTGHRFCTDCWVDYLYHSSRQHKRGHGPAPLACPLCRGGIHVPDVWGVAYELPPVWMQPADDELDGLAPLDDPANADEAEQHHLWAEAAPGAAGKDSAASEAIQGRIAPVTQET